MGKWKRGWQEERRHTLSRGRMESMWLDNSSIQSQSTNAHWVLTMRRSHGLEESGHIYAAAWCEGGTRLLTVLTGSLRSGPVRSISCTSSYCSLRATRVWLQRRRLRPRFRSSPKPQSQYQYLNSSPWLKPDVSMRRGGEFSMKQGQNEQRHIQGGPEYTD